MITKEELIDKLDEIIKLLDKMYETSGFKKNDEKFDKDF